MFEKPTVSTEGHADDVFRHVCELTKLDNRYVYSFSTTISYTENLCSMFLSRTVAAEVCMESKTNESAYKALKKLDCTGNLLFELGGLIEELIKVCGVGTGHDELKPTSFYSSSYMRGS